MSFPKYLINPYLGVFCGGTTFYNLIKIIPEKDYKNKTIMGFIILKTFTTSITGSIVPLTCLIFGKETYEKYKKD